MNDVSSGPSGHKPIELGQQAAPAPQAKALASMLMQTTDNTPLGLSWLIYKREEAGPNGVASISAEKLTEIIDEWREQAAPAPGTTKSPLCLDVKHGAVVDHQCLKESGHAGAHTDGSASWFTDMESLRVQHARKQGGADGFQTGWHAALTRIRAGDSIDELTELVPAPPGRDTET